MNKKTQILQKALMLFATEGYEGIGVQRIVTEVEVTKPTLYHYFGSKEGLLQSIYETYFEQVLQIYKKSLPFQQDLIGTIQKLIEEYVGFAKANEAFFWLMNHLRKGPLNSQSYSIVKPYHDQERQLLIELFHEVSNFHTNLKGQEEFLAINMLSLMNGFLEIKISDNTIQAMNNEDIHKLTKQFLYGVFSL